MGARSLVGILLFLLFAAGSAVAQDRTFSVMAPLGQVEDWGAFRRKLTTLKSLGVDAITVDVWWGDVEQRRGEYDWRYYRKFVKEAQAAGLKVTAIMSTHACGGNVGDVYNRPIPEYVQRMKGDASDAEMFYQDRNGNVSREYVAPWAGDEIYDRYEQLLDSFAKNFADLEPALEKVYVSLGPAGELRYPSYQSGAGWNYPERGFLQAYSKGARRSFREFLEQRFLTIEALNAQWGTSYSSFADVGPPDNEDAFFKEQYRSPYGEAFMGWYQGLLQGHVAKMGRALRQGFGDRLRSVSRGGKIPGIHWLMNDPSQPRAAEAAAGFRDYAELIGEFKKQGLDLTFTAIEMADAPNGDPSFSGAHSLVMEIDGIAKRLGVNLYGENALPIHPEDRGSWHRLFDTLDHSSMKGFTILRIDDLVNGDGSLRLPRDVDDTIIEHQGACAKAAHATRG
jgi:hypothetical protein